MWDGMLFWAFFLCNVQALLCPPTRGRFKPEGTTCTTWTRLDCAPLKAQ